MRTRERHSAPPLQSESIRALWRVNRLYWYCLVGIVLWVMLRGVAGIGSVYDPGDFYHVTVYPWWFLLVVALGAANLGIRSWASIQQERDQLAHSVYYTLGWVFVSMELGLILAGLRLTGGLYSSIWLVVYVIVVGETLMAEREEATIIRWGAGIAIVLGTAPPTVPSLSEALAFALEMFPRLGFLIAVSSVTRRLRENADRRNAELAHLRTEVVQSAERSRLSQEVHDGVGNTLAATVLRLEVTARALARSGGDEKTVVLLQEEAQVLREAMQSVRDWAFFTRPWFTGDEETPASALLTSGATRLSRRVGLPIAVEGAEVLDTALESTRQVLLHLAQEALTNAAKHATGATRATVTVAREGSWICLTVTDDGAGFDLETTVPGVGMQAMQEQARALHGDFTIESQPQSGTRVQVRLPG